MNSENISLAHLFAWLRCSVLVYIVLWLVVLPTLRADEIDNVIAAAMKEQSIPGLALTVVNADGVIKAQGYGFANVEHDVPVRPDTIFQSGSLGKQFTSMAVMILVEECKVTLDNEIGSILTHSPAAWTGITVRHLLTHTSGIGNAYSALDLRRDYTEDELVKQAADATVEFAPGEKFQYSNTGYLLLGVIIHEVAGQPYGDFLRDRIFTPLAMSTAGVISEKDIIRNRAAGYRLINGELKNQEWVSPTFNSTGDGAIYFSVLDLIKWDAALRSRRLLDQSSYNQMWSPAQLNDGTTYPYGFGWNLTELNGHAEHNHGGSWQGFQAHISRFVDDGLTVVVLTNLFGSKPHKIARDVAGHYIATLARHDADNDSD